ncbi:MAG: hypothetical protein A3J24_06900 [Deltaproteobacteria bacterium RIFCSPLOWO2_02_FULL_53_8]|nr:MAG: hypothetical protein A3J24_06900 [Deltaproteobacteria bacterium RIFCSPLOWO2_02_FULL_53_8]
MPIRNCPFTRSINGVYRPILGLRIINPHTGRHFQTIGIIDTGADECAVPADLAPLLDHNLEKGLSKKISTGNGDNVAYSHITKFELFHPATGRLLHTVSDTPIDFLPNLRVVLLGVNSFLSRFILHIDYPKKTFSISTP